MPTVNELYFDAAVRHQIGIRRFSSGEVQRVLALLEKADADLTRKLEARLEKLAGRPLDRTGARLKALLADVRAARASAMVKLRSLTRESLLALAGDEVGFEQRLIQGAVPFELSFNSVRADQLRAIVLSRPFQGKLLNEWYRSIEAADALRLRQAIQLGLAQGENVPTMVRRIRGTRAQGFTDGILNLTKNQASAVVRTAVNHVSNAAREAMWNANADIIQALRWTSTLDGRTTPICFSRDGDLAPIGDNPLPEGAERLDPPGARPPAHVACLPGTGLVAPCGRITAASKRFYEGEVIVICTAAGHELTCTPNHPVLTDRGWIAAHLLDRGYSVVRYLGGENPFPGIEDQDQEGPAAIEEVARPFLEGPRIERVTTARGDFHGDGIDGEVCVVGADGCLEVEGNSTLNHQGIEERFERRSRIHSPLPGARPPDALFQGAFPSTRRFVGGRNLARALIGGSAIPGALIGSTSTLPLFGMSPSEPSSLGVAARLDTMLAEDPVHDDAGEFATAAEVIDALAGQVALDQVISVERRDFSGHVYNLQTTSGIYFATKGSIITHNCRSIMVAVLKGVGLLGTRPFVLVGREKVDFRALARQQGIGVPEARRRWAATHVGSVPAKMTYQQWLSRQSAAFQDEVLGKAKGALFRRGDLTLNEFVDRRGNELTLAQLRRTHPEAFEQAGL